MLIQLPRFLYLNLIIIIIIIIYIYMFQIYYRYLQLKYKINKVLPTIITDVGKYYIICLFHSSICFILVLVYLIYNMFCL